MGAAIEQQVERAAAEGRRFAVFDIPLLVESGRWRRQLDRVLVIDCSEATQVERVVSRSGLSPEAVRAIIAAQAPRALRLAAADVVICNEGMSLAQFEAEVGSVAEAFGL